MWEKVPETRIFLKYKVQALETYHSRFVTRNDINEFKARVGETVNSFSSTERRRFTNFYK